MNGLCTVIGRTFGGDVFTVLHTGDDERFGTVIGRIVGVDVFTVLHTGADERFVHSN